MERILRFVKQAGVAAGITAGSLTLLGYLAQTMLTINPAFQPLNIANLVGAGVAAAFGGSLAWEAAKEYTDQPYRHFLRLSAIVMLASYSVLIIQAPAMNGATMEAIAVLGLAHAMAAVTVVWSLFKWHENQK